METKKRKVYQSFYFSLNQSEEIHSDLFDSMNNYYLASKHRIIWIEMNNIICYSSKYISSQPQHSLMVLSMLLSIIIIIIIIVIIINRCCHYVINGIISDVWDISLIVESHLYF